MSAPGLTNPRAWDYPSLVLAAEMAAREARQRRQQAADLLAGISAEHAGTRARLADAGPRDGPASRPSSVRPLADLHDRHPVLVEVIDALESGRRVSIESPPQMQRVSGPPGADAVAAPESGAGAAGELRPAVSEPFALARRIS